MHRCQLSLMQLRSGNVWQLTSNMAYIEYSLTKVFNNARYVCNKLICCRQSALYRKPTTIRINQPTLCPELAESLMLGYVRVQVDQIMKIFDSVTKTADAEVFVSEWRQVKHLPFIS